MNLQKYAQKVSGFTLIELLVAMGVAGILMGIAVPRFYALLPGIRLASAARQVATDLQLARMRAISQRVPVTVTFTPPTSYNFGADSRDFTQLYPGTTIAVVPANPTFTTVGAATVTTITLTNNGVNRTVTVNAAGRVLTQ
ncbi:MAG TPA: GspH/FimT family pseudopilin [Candidatus Binatia bacterium]|jgi:prepilin-type N-terminal cleavage/methylation domain-containing protein